MDIEKLESLRDRLAKATGPDRELDFAIARYEGWTQHSDEGEQVFNDTVSLWWAEPGESWSPVSTPPLYTGSHDAAISFVERLLPGWCWSVRVVRSAPLGAADLHPQLGTGNIHHHFDGYTPCLALLSAAFDSLIEIEKAKENRKC